MRNIQMLTLDSAKLVVLALLGSLCTLCSLACLPSLGLGIALLSEQTAAWFRTLQWNPVPVASLLKQIGYAPHADWPWIQSGIDQLLRLESGPTVITAATLLWAFVLIVFDQVHPSAHFLAVQLHKSQYHCI
jgi:hypothetical protein